MAIQPGSPREARPHLQAVPERGLPPVLPAKYAPPRFPPDLVPVDASHWLDRIVDHELAIVRAPIGYGKTAWCTALFTEAQATGWRTAWLSVDAEDDMATIVGAIVGLSHFAFKTDDDSRAPSKEVTPHLLATALAERIDGGGGPFLLILDDVDRLADPLAIEMINRLLRHPPVHLRLVLSGDGVSAINGDDAERRGMVLRIGLNELKLADRDVACFLGFEDRRLSALLEGWPAGVRMAIRNDGLEALVARISQYLVPVIDDLSADERLFLQRVALVPMFNAELGQLFGTGADAAVMSRDLIAKGLLIAPEPTRLGWYRLHPAFRIVLRSGLEKAEPGTSTQLHCVAARYLATQQLGADAIEQALAGQDYEYAATLIAEQAASMIEKGEIAPLAAFMDALPSGYITPNLALLRARAWVRTLDGDNEAIAAISALENHGARQEAQAIGLVRRAYAEDRLSDAIVACEQLLDRPDELSDFGVAMLRTIVAQGALGRGLFGLAHEVLRPLLLRGAKQALDLPAALAIVVRASLARAQGQLAETERVLRDATLPADRPLVVAIVEASRARCCYERGDQKNAAQLAETSLQTLEASVFQEALLHACRVAIRVAAASDDKGRAAALIDRAELLAFERNWAPLKAMCVVERARLCLPQTIDAETVVTIGGEDTAIRDPLSIEGRAFALLSEMRVYEAIADGDRPRLTLVAERLLRLASNADNAELRTLATLYNILPQLSGRCDKMVELETVRFLNHAASAGFHRTIVDLLDVTGVRAVQNFCREAYSSGSFLALLKLVEPRRSNSALDGGNGTAPGEAFSFLTEREIEILNALKSGESNKEIARTLELAPETVKWHLKNVMRKLRAGSREEAVHHAATLGLKLIDHPAAD